jgi:hypothetical protein
MRTLRLYFNSRYRRATDKLEPGARFSSDLTPRPPGRHLTGLIVVTATRGLLGQEVIIHRRQRLRGDPYRGGLTPNGSFDVQN